MVHTYLCPVLSFNQLTFPLKGSKQACFEKVDVEWKFSILLSTRIVLLWLQKHMSFSCSFSVCVCVCLCVCVWRGKDWGISVWLWDKIVSECAHRGFISPKTAHTLTHIHLLRLRGVVLRFYPFLMPSGYCFGQSMCCLLSNHPACLWCLYLVSGVMMHGWLKPRMETVILAVWKSILFGNVLISPKTMKHI